MAIQFMLIKDKDGNIIENPQCVALSNVYIIDDKNRIIENKEFVIKERIIENNKIKIE
ncbi:MAG: hypothetical protein QW734_03785 [Candidatus Bathyarchaeia archaeon]